MTGKQKKRLSALEELMDDDDDPEMAVPETLQVALASDAIRRRWR